MKPVFTYRIGTTHKGEFREYHLIRVKYQDDKPVQSKSVFKGGGDVKTFLRDEDMAELVFSKPILDLDNNLEEFQPKKSDKGHWIAFEKIPHDDMRKDFKKWIVGQTLIAPEGEGDCAWYHDFKNFYFAWIQGKEAIPFD